MQMMQRRWWSVAGFMIVVMVLSACGESAVELAPISGKWIHHSAQDQDWTYEFPNDTTVRFAIDRQRTEWSITGIRMRGSIIEIDVDGNLGIGGRQNSTIKVEILEENALFISSGLHPGIPFQRAS
jgi:hypothetical protein